MRMVHALEWICKQMAQFRSCTCVLESTVGAAQQLGLPACVQHPPLRRHYLHSARSTNAACQRLHAGHVGHLAAS